MDKEGYIKELKSTVGSFIGKDVDETFNYLRKNYGCANYKVADNGDIEFIFPANGIVDCKHKIKVSPNQLIMTR